ncbi:MAG: hypothetical protein ACR2O3_10475 [Rhizobiaceae bacterium]
MSSVTEPRLCHIPDKFSADARNGYAQNSAVDSASEAFQTISTILNAAGEIQTHNPGCREALQICRATLQLSELIGAICETQEFGRSAALSDPEPLDLIDFLKMSMDRFSRNYKVDFDFFVNCDESVIPEIYADRTLLGLVLDLLFDELAVQPATDTVINVEVERLARSIRLTVSCDPEFTTHSSQPARQGTECGNMNCTDELEKLVSMLQAKISRSKTLDDRRVVELRIPINAGISLPDLSSIASELVRLPSVQGQNSRENPIPRIQRTG